jgi:dihydrolipoamide dehydrogenase
VAGIVKLTADLGERSVEGRARLLGPGEISVGERRVRAKRVIVATGSRPVVPPQWRKLRGPILTSDTLFEQHDLPRRMGVVGLGAVGLEIAQALSRMGIEVSAFGKGNTVGGLDDAVVNDQALALLRSEVKVLMDCEANVREDANGLHVECGEQLTTVDAVFAALGRQPNIEGLGLEALGVDLDDHGMPKINSHTLQIEDLPVFFAGDVTHDMPILHEANDEGHIAAYNALRETPTCFQRRIPLSIVFSDPNIASVGAQLSELDAASIAIGSVDFADQGRARIAGENRGVLRIYVNRNDGLILGAQLCAPRGEHLAHLLALAIDNQATVHSLLRMPFYHPVFEEGLRTALRDAARQLVVQINSDLAACGPLGAVALD